MRLPEAVPQLCAGESYLLRAWHLDDVDLVREAAEDDYIPLVTTVPVPYSESEGVSFVHRQWRRTTDGKGYPFVIAHADSGTPVGTIGLWLHDIVKGRASLGYWVLESARGKGAAAAALRAVTDWALGDLRIPRVELFIEPWNTASVRTAERAGYQREGLLRSWQHIGDSRRDMLVYSRLRIEHVGPFA